MDLRLLIVSVTGADSSCRRSSEHTVAKLSAFKDSSKLSRRFDLSIAHMRVFPLGKGLKPVYIYLSENHEAAILHALFIHLFGVMLSMCETSHSRVNLAERCLCEIKITREKIALLR